MFRGRLNSFSNTIWREARRKGVENEKDLRLERRLTRTGTIFYIATGRHREAYKLSVTLCFLVPSTKRLCIVCLGSCTIVETLRD